MPGRHLADVSLWVAIATILSLFDIKKIQGKDGQEITPKVGMDSGLTRSETRIFNNDIISSHPKPYRCSVQLRNDKAKDLIGQIKVDLMDE